MWCIPYESYTVKINYPSNEVKTRLAPLVEPSIYFRFLSWKPHTTFEGYVNSNEFYLKPIIYSGSKGIAVIAHGAIQNDKVIITIKLGDSTMLLINLLFMIAVLIGIANSSFGGVLLFVLIGYLIILATFKWESPWIRDALLNALK